MLQLVRGLAWQMPGHIGLILGYTHQIRALFWHGSGCEGLSFRTTSETWVGEHGE